MPPRRPMPEVRPSRWSLGLGVVAAVLLAGCGNIGQPIPARVSPTAAAEVSFPPATYPPAVPGASGAGIVGQDCANPSGLVPRPSATPGTFLSLLNHLFDSRTLPATLLYFDQAAWPEEVESWAGGGQPWRRTYVSSDIQVLPLWSSGTTLAQLVADDCSASLVLSSWIVSYCKPGTRFSACDPGITATSLAIDRSGTWLLWYLNSGYQG
jgi:hypothetical protein